MKKTLSSGFLLVLVLLVALAATPAFGAGGGGGASEKVPVFVGFTHQPGPAEEGLVRKAGGEIKYTYHLVPAIAASLPQAAIDGLGRNPNVEYIEPDIEVHLIDHGTTSGDDELNNTWGVKHIGSGAVHRSNKGAGVKVAILDTGIDTDHPDLNYDPACSWGTKYGSVEDGHSHGTHTAGTVAALDNDTGVVGVAPEGTLCIFKVLSDRGSGSYRDIIAALDFIFDYNNNADVPIRVTNNSYGSVGDPGATVKAAFDRTYANGVLHVAAAGNETKPKNPSDNCIYPALWTSLIATAATNQNDGRASFSSICPEVELAAPGYGVNSTLPDGEYGTKNATSMASPHVGGVAALVLAANPGWSNFDVRARLQVTAADLGDPNKYGYGLVQANDAAACGGCAPPPSNDPPTVSITSPTDGSNPASGASIDFAGSASDTEDGDLAASLAWTSSIDGSIGSGDSFSKTLSDGIHTITASVTDSGSQTGSASISITVGDPPPEATTVSVSSITYGTEGGKDGKKHLRITVALVDDLENTVAGASVSIKLDNTTTGKSWTGTGTTGVDGTVTFSRKNAESGTYTTKVTGVTAAGLTWDGSTAPNSYPK